jgi:crotonobetainyl-CoA:carnitine CoA-transferase CaiB-like acyl-CoA transferase
MSLDNAGDRSEFNLHAHLEQLLGGLGLSPRDTGGEIRFQGADPILDSTARIGAISALSLAVRNAAVAAIWRIRADKGQDMEIDLRRAVHSVTPFSSMHYITLNGRPPHLEDPDNAFALGMYRTRDDRSVMVTNPYPRIRDDMARLMGVPNQREAVAKAIAQWNALDLEKAAHERGLVAAMARTPEEWASEAQYKALAGAPIIEIEKIGDSEPEPFVSSTRPLGGVRALGMAHVIAGPEIGRSLAEYGADVLNLWEPNSMEHLIAYVNAHLGMRSATVQAASSEGNRRVKDLLREADVFFENRRGGHVERLGLSPEECARTRPGIVHVSIKCYGHVGPWANRPGFDPQALCVAGFAVQEGTRDAPKLPPSMALGDFVAGRLAAAGALAALIRRATQGGSYRVRVNLTRVVMWYLSLGLLPKGLDRSGPEHQVQPPELFTAQTGMGEYRGLAPLVRMSETPGHFDTVLVPRGTSKLEWLPR